MRSKVLIGAEGNPTANLGFFGIIHENIMLPEVQKRILEQEMRGDMSLLDVKEIDKYDLEIAKPVLSISNCNAGVIIKTSLAQLTSPRNVILADSEECHVFGEILVERSLDDKGGTVFEATCTDSGDCKHLQKSNAAS
jgi:hypothetical protein